MSEKLTAYGLSTDQLELFLKTGDKIEFSNDQIDQDVLLVSLVSDTLASPLPAVTEHRESLSLLEHFSRLIDIGAGTTVLNMLTSPKTDIVFLNQIKDYGKELSKKALCDAERQTGFVVYCAAIAAALVHKEVKITRLSYEALEHDLKQLSDKPWLSASLAELFRQALARCAAIKNANKEFLSDSEKNSG